MTKKIYLALLSILGFASACESGADMYGTPSATFRAKITVTNESNEPIPDVSISSKVDGYTEQSGLRTGADGKVTLNLDIFPQQSQMITLYATDTDGVDNGVYRKDSVMVEVKSTDFTGGSGWNHGTATKDAPIVMKNGEVE